MYYSTIGVLAILILFIVNWDMLRGFDVSFDKAAWNVYRRFLFVVLIYYITDVFWGILESQKLVAALFSDTTIYFVAMAMGISFWAEYTVAYLDEKNAFGRFLVYAGRFIACAIAILVIINIFVPIYFTVDDKCVYHDLLARDIMLVLQILMLLTISVYAVSSMFRVDRASSKRTRCKILASFGFIMAVCLFVQLWFPYLPLYSIGYMLGTCLLHSFVASDEKEDYKREQEEAKKIVELKDRFKSLLDNMPGMTFTKDAKTGVYLACNQAFADYAHKETPEGVVGLTDAQIFDAETAAHFVEDDRIALSLSKAYIFYEDVPDAVGNQRQLQTTKIKYKDTAGRLCVLGMCQDVTDMVRIQHEQAMTKEAYESAVSSGLMYTHIAQTLARDYIDMYYVNTDTEEFIEYGMGEESGTLSEIRRGWHFFSDCKAELAENVYPDDKESFLQAMNRKTLMKALGRKDTFIMTYRQNGSDGPVYVNMKISRMIDKDEPYIILCFTNVDAEMRETVAKSIALADALKSAEQANKEKTSFLSGMSHEIRTPINAIIGLHTLALKNENLETGTRDYLEKIGDSAQNLLGLINDILTQTGSTVNPQGIEETLSSRYLSGEINPEAVRILVVDDNPIEVEHARIVLEEVGIEADTCTSGQEALRKMEIQHAKHTPYNIVLMDWIMPGMSGQETSAEINKLYEDESTVVVLTANNWDNIREDAESVGVDNFLLKPLFASSVLENLQQIARRNKINIFKEKKRAKLAGRRIILAEDVEINAEIMIDTLEIENIKVDHASNGKEAVELFEKSTAGIYAAILMDVRMPEMDGLEAAEVIRAMEREDAKKIPIIALTANTFDEDVQRSLQAGMNAHLSKPVDTDQLIRVLGELVYEAEYSDC